MKTWVFALLESIIATFGLAAFFWADNLILATAAAVLAAALAIGKPLLSARKQRQLEAYRDRQYEESLESVDGQLKELLDEVIDPPLPHRATIVVLLEHRFAEQADMLVDQYDCIVQAISEGNPESERLAATFTSKTAQWSVGMYLQGLAALAAGKTEDAYAHFSAATQEQATWVAPWLGWATAAYRRGLWNEICEHHPHRCGVELLPYGAGDENSFLELSEGERQQLAQQFQQTASSLGQYYTIAEFCRSKERIAASRAELKKVA